VSESEQEMRRKGKKKNKNSQYIKMIQHFKTNNTHLSRSTKPKKMNAQTLTQSEKTYPPALFTPHCKKKQWHTKSKSKETFQSKNSTF
jgi:hypothetical protein